MFLHLIFFLHKYTELKVPFPIILFLYNSYESVIEGKFCLNILLNKDNLNLSSK